MGTIRKKEFEKQLIEARFPPVSTACIGRKPDHHRPSYKCRSSSGMLSNGTASSP